MASHEADATAPRGARIAGAIMLLNAAALALEGALGVTEQPLGGSLPVRVLVGFALGGAVLLGSMAAVKVARVLTIIGAVALPVLLLSQEQQLLGALQLAFSAALLLLLFGSAGPLRIALALALSGGFFALEAAGLYGIWTGRHPFARLLMAGDLEPGPIADVTGSGALYRLSLPPGSWYLKTDAAARKENPLADRWLVRPDRDAHVMVVVETLAAGSVVEMERFRDAVVGNIEKGQEAFAVSREGPLSTTLEEGHLIEGTSRMKGQSLEWRIALYLQSPHIVQVVGFGNARSFPDVDAEVRAIVGSLSF